jgi:SAM-dependent methyltransferase
MNATRSITHEGSPERFDPRADSGRLVHSEHIARYGFASQLAAGAAVLDAGCGTGYGTAILAAAGPSRLLAVDVAEEAVERTRAVVEGRAEVAVADLRSLPFEDDAVDLVVCFEVIEHLERREAALAELVRVLRPGGTLVISSPNPREYLAGNEFHVHEYPPEELEQELREHFANVRLHSQSAWLASRVDGAGDGVVDVVDGYTPTREGTFTLAVASDRTLPEMHARIVLGDPFEVRWWVDRIEESRVEAVAAHNESRRTRDDLEQARERAQALAARLVDLEQELAGAVSAHGDLEDARRELETIRYRFDRAERVIADLQGSFSWRITAPLRRLKASLRGS